MLKGDTEEMSITMSLDPSKSLASSVYSSFPRLGYSRHTWELYEGFLEGRIRALSLLIHLLS